MYGSGKKKGAAICEVAEAYGVGIDAVETWDCKPKGLLRHFDKAVIRVAQNTARHSGDCLQRLQMQLHKSDLDKTHIHSILLTYGPEALAKNAERFKRGEHAISDLESDNP